MKHIVLTECYDTLLISEDGRKLSISNAQAEELAQFIDKYRLKSEYIIWGNKSVTFLNYVGYIQCPTFSIEILPKVSIHNDKNIMRLVLIEMLNECGYINGTTSDLAQLELINGSLLEIFGRIYAHTLFIEMNRGLATKSHQVKENLMTLKGALITSKHIKENLSRNKKFMAYCEYEKRTINHELNQVFRAANKLLTKKINNLETQKLLKQIDHFLYGVTFHSFSKKKLSRISLDRTINRFESPFLLARQLLMNVAGTFNSDDHSSFSLLFEMNVLYEQYIAVLMRKATEHKVHEQHNVYRLLVNEKNNRNIFQLKPDIVVDDGSTQIILDTKWKSLTKGNRSGVRREDLFQMYAYLTRYDHAQTAILLYPKQLDLDFDDEIDLESWYLHADPQKKLKVYEISLESKLKTVEQLSSIISQEFYKRT